MKNGSDQRKIDTTIMNNLFTRGDLIKLYGLRSKCCHPLESASLCKSFTINTWANEKINMTFLPLQTKNGGKLFSDFIPVYQLYEKSRITDARFN